MKPFDVLRTGFAESGERWAYPKVPRIALHFIRATLAAAER